MVRFRILNRRIRPISFLLLLFFCICSTLILSANYGSNERGRSKGITDWFKGLSLQLSVSRDVKDVFFLLWTRRQKEPQIFGRDGDISVNQLRQTHFNTSNRVLVMFHGFADHSRTSWALLLKAAYLELEDVNIVSVDWSKLAKQPWYSTAVRSAHLVGEHVSRLLLQMIAEGVPVTSMHLLGASLGAHVASSTAYFLRKSANLRVSRITGLDPCGPLFHSAPLSRRLDASDATFVDVVHTAGKWMGMTEALGHVDFFVNDGHAPQPGCEQKESLDLACSHFKAWQIFGAALKPDANFVAMRCRDDQDFHSGQCCLRHYNEINEKGVLVNNDNDTELDESDKNDYNVIKPLFVTVGDTNPLVRGKYYFVTNAEAPLQKHKWYESVQCHLMQNVTVVNKT